jgi:hypothetical protein
LRKENDIMKANLKKILGLAALGMTLLTNIVPTWAGYKYAQEVLIQNDNGYLWANGSMVGARYSSDSKQNIGCTAYTFQSYSWTACFATDRAGNSLVCGSGDPRWAAVVQGMTDSSYVWFELGYNSNGGDCKSIMLWNESYLLK